MDIAAYQMFQALQNHMGDKLVYSYYGPGGNAATSDTRLYVTKNSKTGEVVLWGLNFSNTTDTTVNVDLTNLGFTATSGTLMTLGWNPATVATYGPTQLTNPSGVFETEYIDWSSSLLTGLNTSNLNLTLPHAEVTALILSVPEPSGLALLLTGLLGLLAYVWRKRRLHYAGSNSIYSIWNEPDNGARIG